jgi:hypothetical protein
MSKRNNGNVRLLQGIIAKVMVAMLFMVFFDCESLTYAAVSQTLKGTVYVKETAVPADGASQTIVSVLLKDQNGNDLSVSPEKVKLTTSLGLLDGKVTSSVYGQYTSVLTAPVTTGVAFISAEVDGVVVPDMARVNFKAGAPSPSHSVITASSQSLPADGFSQTVISVLLKDRYGNDVADRADSLQLSTTLGKLSNVTYETYGRYESRIVSAVYGSLGSLTGSLGPVPPLKFNFEQGAVPAGTPNKSTIPTTFSLTYESYGSYKAMLTAPSSAGIAEIKASLNGMSIISSVHVAFTGESSSNMLTGLRFVQLSYPVRVRQQLSTSLEAAQSNSTVSNVTSYATYKVTDPSIAAVDSSGTVQALRRGQTVLTATYGGFSAETTILVIGDNQGNTNGTPTNTGNPSPPGIPTPITTPSGLIIEVIPKDGQGEQQEISPEDIKKGIIVLRTVSAGGQINITAANIKEIRAINPQAVLVIQVGSATMSLPISELDLQAFSQKYGFPEDSIRFEVIIREPNQPVDQAIRQSVEAMKARLLAAPMEFEVRVIGENSQSVFISSFNRFVTRTLSVNMNTIPATATGVWWVPGSNEFKFVPTFFEQKDGQWLAVMKRQGASIYTVIDRPVSFLDVKGHWSAGDVELLASKLIIQGRSEEAFEPDATITRAEIAALLVRSLGLNESNEKGPFPDVGGWYETAVSTAYQAGLISG